MVIQILKGGIVATITVRQLCQLVMDDIESIKAHHDLKSLAPLEETRQRLRKNVEELVIRSKEEEGKWMT